MKFPYSMLLDFVNTSLGPEELGDLLTMAGFELEGIESVEGHPVLDIKVMSNRGDGLSVFGLAREVLAKDPNSVATDLYRIAAGRFESCSQSNAASPAQVTIETDDCGRYACLILKNTKNGSSETWMQDRLRRSGMRPISLLVDITNYVMLELGQPLHAFDFDKLEGGEIVVREARPGERLTTLNGVEHGLQRGQMMICDVSKPVAVAGVMGGSETEVGPDTVNVLLESAHFLNTSVRRTRKQLGLNTEASYRFERSVDPDGVVAALYRCVELVKAATPQVESSAIVDVYPGKASRDAIRFRVERASLLLGMSVTVSQCTHYLSRLGFEIQLRDDSELWVTPPAWRPDIVREVDLVEEIGRIHGYELIPERLLQGTTKSGGPQGFELWTDWLRQAALRSGLTQVISHSLRDLHPLDEADAVRLGPRTPASPDTGYLRNSLLPSLSDAARRNNPKEIQIFELGRVFCGVGEKYLEALRFSVLSAGPVTPGSWNSPGAGPSGFFTVKGVLESVMESVGVTTRLVPSDVADRRLHPTRQAVVFAGDQPIGIIGQLHPDVANECDLPLETTVFEILARAAFENRDLSLKLQPVSRHPSVRRDMSVLADQSITYEKLAAAIETSLGDVLEKQWLFDEFVGQGIPSGMRALGIAIQLRKSDSTFTDEEANQVRDRAVAALVDLGATTR